MKKIDLSSWVCLFGAFLLLSVPLRWILAWLTAAIVHEGFHILAVRAFQGKIFRIRVGITGAVIEVCPMAPGKELVCALAGPVGGLLLLPLARILPTIALCGLFQSLWNLLPIYPMDGGRALRCLLCMGLGDRRSEQLGNAIGNLVLILLLLLSIYGAFRRGLGLLPVVIAGMLIFRFFSRKTGALQSQYASFFPKG